MTHKDDALDSMLRHLGAAYYDSLHGRAAAGDVIRAVDKVAEHMGEHPVTEGKIPRPQPDEHRAEHPGTVRHTSKLHSRVKDVMTTQVITVDRITPFKDIASLLVENKISGVPVLTLGRHVAGVVTEADLLSARDTHAGERKKWTGVLRYATDHGRFSRLTAEELMTSPAITIHPDASVAAAAKAMTSHHVKRLPVVDKDGTLLGLVSRRDVLTAFLVPDDAIASQVREILAQLIPDMEGDVTVRVHGGVVTLVGSLPVEVLHGAAAAAIALSWDIDGVVDVIDHLASPQLA